MPQKIPEMVELLARRLAGSSADLWVFDDTPEIGSPSGRMLRLTPEPFQQRQFWHEFVPLVRDMLDGLREPTEAMLIAAREHDDNGGRWRAMIDTALGKE